MLLIHDPSSKKLSKAGVVAFKRVKLAKLGSFSESHSLLHSGLELATTKMIWTAELKNSYTVAQKVGVRSGAVTAHVSCCRPAGSPG